MATVPIQARVRASLKVNENRKKLQRGFIQLTLICVIEQVFGPGHLITLLIYSHPNPTSHGFVRSGIHDGGNGLIFNDLLIPLLTC